MLEPRNSLIDLEKIRILETAINCTLEPFDDLEIEKITDLDHNKYIMVITRKNHIYYPRNPECAREDKFTNNEWGEVNCVLKPIRVVISGTNLKASLQVFGVEIDCVNPVLKYVETQPSGDHGAATPEGVWQVSADLINNLLKKLTKYGQFRICDGFTEDELKINENIADGESVIPPSLVVINYPFLRLESPKCAKLIPHTKCKNIHVCVPCKNYKKDYFRRRAKKKRILNDSDLDDISEDEEHPKRLKKITKKNISAKSSGTKNVELRTIEVKLENIVEDTSSDN